MFISNLGISRPRKLFLYITVVTLCFLSYYALTHVYRFESPNSLHDLPGERPLGPIEHVPHAPIADDTDILMPGHFDFQQDRRVPANYIANLTLIMDECDMKKVSVSECLDYIQKNQRAYMYLSNPNAELTSSACPENDPMLFHIYWKGPFTDKLSLTIKSFLYSQPLECSRLWVWMDSWGSKEDLETNEFSSPLLEFSSNVEFKQWSLEDEVKKSPDFANLSPKAVKTVAYSDMVRFVVLNLYGGLYHDADVLFLRDYRPLYYAPEAFAYQWSYTPKFNTAIFRMRANSTVSRWLVNRAIANGSFHPENINQYLSEWNNKFTEFPEKPELLMLPLALFDPLWLKNDDHQRGKKLLPNLNKFTDAFDSAKVEGEFDLLLDDEMPEREFENFFPGAWSYHWHNNWKTPIAKGSWMGVLLKSFDDFLYNEGRNYYGEAFEKSE
ncbi:hypothetical protein K493DRAFT_315743 [Basidiobolus meristosporus CBS 931.73]|uniref:Glycosyltransferase family 32 protein n=1 Tax=Basidiobolus meristosporus CBS 931.73 TaxID=1314790 RepID=A0A1Y1Y7I3_9FUNG|nr:hypothetical protein K493DRAFT_315743 [Basidiobolus meristosporus CBS 931.73]|eukprot:ORX93948.1 hypothetical protein K493DRAFT_315743 [Basidiobolus meristosporus CBS 931.73]